MGGMTTSSKEGVPDRLGPAPSAPLDRVEWRVDSEPYERDGRFSCRYVPHLNAAIIADLFDSWVGPGGWSDEYKAGEIEGHFVLYCRIAVEVRPGEWVSRTDVGRPSEFESAKGAVSDAFKRAACLKWGVGRNVYMLPTLWAACKKNAKGKAIPFDGVTQAELIRKLKELGYADADAATTGDEGPDGSATDRETEPVSDASSDDPMAQLNALGLRGPKLSEVRRALKEVEVPWPPRNLTDEQRAAFQAVLNGVAA